MELICGNSTTAVANISFKKRFTILVFDSGVGGLSVYDELRKLLPQQHYLYVLDNVAFPYGEKSEEFLVKRVVAIVTAVSRRYPLTLVVIACNSASTVTLSALRSHFKFPIVGVVPAIKPAARLTRNGVVGVLATCGTVKRHYTHELVVRFGSKCKTEMLGSAELVELVEAKLHGQLISVEKIKRILQPWLIMSNPPDTVVLGCTHFPLISKELQQVLPEGTCLVDSGAAIARRTVWLLENKFSHTVFIDDIDHNIAFCMDINDKAIQLIPVLQRYGFQKLEKLML